MTTNVKVAQNVSSDGAIITGFRYIDVNTTLGDEGGGASPTPTTTEFLLYIPIQLLQVKLLFQEQSRLQIDQLKEQLFDIVWEH